MERLFFNWVTGPIIGGKFEDKAIDPQRLSIHPQILHSQRYDSKFIFRWHYRQILLAGFLRAIGDVSAIVSINMVKKALEGVKAGVPPANSIKSFGFVFFVQALRSLTLNHHEYLMDMVGLKTRIYLSNLIYDKALENTTSLVDNYGEEGRGHIINMLTIDVSCVEGAFSNFHTIWSSPLQALLILYNLYHLLGNPAFVGFTIVAAYIFIQWKITKIIRKYRRRVFKSTDLRMSRLEEVFTTIKIIKALALEKKFQSRILAARLLELKSLRKYHVLKSLTLGVSIFVPVFACFISLLLIYKYSSLITFPSGLAIVAVIALFKTLRIHVTMLPTVVNTVVNANVALKRIQAFLTTIKQPETEFLANQPFKFEVVNDSSFILSYKGSGYLIKQGELVVIEGDTNEAANLLKALKCFLAEHWASKKFIHCSASKPWLQYCSLRKCITSMNSGSPPSNQYMDVVEACELSKDLSSISDTQTWAAPPNGSNLSSGQRHRICLARAAYSDAQIVILDDLFSSLDCATAEAVRKNCVSNLMSKKTRIVVGCAEDYNQVDLVINLGDTSSNRIQFMPDQKLTQFNPLPRSTFLLLSKTNFGDSQDSLENSVGLEKGKPGNKIYNESISGRLIWLWIRGSGGILFALSCIALVIAINQCRISTDRLVSSWKGTPSDKSLIAYALLCIAQGLLPFVLSLIFGIACTGSSNQVHKRAVESLLLTPYLFFISTTPGKLLSRFGKDQEILDFDLIVSSRTCLIMAGLLIFTVQAIFTAQPWLGIPLSLTIVLYWPLQLVYRKSLRAAQRTAAKRRNPIVGLVLETLDGVDIIKGVKKESTFKREMAELILSHSKAICFLLTSQAWFSLRIELLGNLGTLCVGICAVFLGTDPVISSLAISYSSNLAGDTMWAIRKWAQAETHLISFERLSKLTNLPREGGSHGIILDSELSLKLSGAITLCSVYASFTSVSHPFLKSLNLEVSSGSRVGIFGRTGSGKSSLLLVLLGMIEITDGFLHFDGKQVDFATVRQQVGYVCQEATLFGGTIRFNLDPEGRLPDQELWEMMKLLGLEQLCLDSVVESANTLLSVRELVSFGRALLRRPPILLFDEPLASLDPSHRKALLKSNELHQKWIRGTTILVVSHQMEWLKWCQVYYEMVDGTLLSSSLMAKD